MKDPYITQKRLQQAKDRLPKTASAWKEESFESRLRSCCLLLFLYGFLTTTEAGNVRRRINHKFDGVK